ncbi:BID domain-containing T4SS effector [Bartonella taylorii]|uniref:BID domain-containing T4SS effector n=1 Tax=Bartonella taylorii TaxID=33046 RepID=UPI001ABBE139|nr:BID domain-containing T4SS effector [Bartonella taylorii]
MKKSHSPQYPITQKVLEEQIKKLRKVRPSPYSEEPVQADINVGESSSKKPSEEVIYADIIIGEPSGKPRPKPEETIYAEVNVGESSARPHPEATVRAGASSQVKLPLTQEELASKLQKNATIQNFQEKIRSLCETVYGNRNTLDMQLNKVLKNPDVGTRLSYDLAGSPEIFGPFRGKQVLGIKSPARKRAEEGSWNLCETVEQYVCHVKQLAKEMKQPDYVKNEKLQKKSAMRDHHYPTKEKQHTVREQDVQQRRHPPKQGIAI